LQHRQIARDLDLTETSLRAWVTQAKIDVGNGSPEALTTTERELHRSGGVAQRLRLGEA
jgi:transposase-like protein